MSGQRMPERRRVPRRRLPSRRHDEPAADGCNPPAGTPGAALRQKAAQLAEQNAEVDRRHALVEEARADLQGQAEQLALSAKYKSEFLANMSHELRSPLNSLLLLAEQMRQNRDQNLTERQLEMVRVMDASGRDLLHLINDILDLSKIEAGGATVEIGDVALATLGSELDKSFHHQAEAKGLDWTLAFDPRLPPVLRTDGQRVKQLLTNLLSNALKFTGKGGISLSAQAVASGWSPGHHALDAAPLVVAFSVRDSGIGIALEKRKLIFEAFQQADASTSRRYGGTGLGLAISREIARLLDGELLVHSEEGVGSTFTFYLPQPRLETAAQADHAALPCASAALPTEMADAEDGAAEPPLLLIIEDDPVFARTLQELAREHGYRILVAASGAQGLDLARRHRPAAITLDLELPDVDGWDIVDRLRADPATAAIPVHVISVRDRPHSQARHRIASYTTKPADLDTLSQVFAGVTAVVGEAGHPFNGQTGDVVDFLRRAKRAIPLVGQDAALPEDEILAGKRVMIVDDDARNLFALTGLLENHGMQVEALDSGTAALARLEGGPAVDLVLMDIMMPDIDGYEAMRRIRAVSRFTTLPVIALTAKAMLEDRAKCLAAGASDYATKPVDSAQLLAQLRTWLGGASELPR